MSSDEEASSLLERRSIPGTKESRLKVLSILKS